MPTRLPAAAWLLGAAGLIPFLGCGFVAVGASQSMQSAAGMTGLIGYGAVILSFLGGVHWGFALAPAPGTAAVGVGNTGLGIPTATRLTLGVVPSLIGWLALLVLMMLNGEAALAVLIAGFLLAIGGEIRLRRGGHLPANYLAMRYVLTLIVGLCLATVLTLRLIGAKIVF